jgi:hypothetical protein
MDKWRIKAIRTYQSNRPYRDGTPRGIPSSVVPQFSINTVLYATSKSIHHQHFLPAALEHWALNIEQIMDWGLDNVRLRECRGQDRK